MYKVSERCPSVPESVYCLFVFVVVVLFPVVGIGMIVESSNLRQLLKLTLQGSFDRPC